MSTGGGTYACCTGGGRLRLPRGGDDGSAGRQKAAGHVWKDGDVEQGRARRGWDTGGDFAPAA
ncbi:MAG TPA: hypothetical protein VK399_15410 [Longimicrobiaceae bacterium]|nr:hypothetical protein [Longimicrobiaceae bacterium]